MFDKLILLVTILSTFRCHVIGIPLTSGTFKGIMDNLTIDADNDSEIVEVVSSELPKDVVESHIIDLSVYGQSLYGRPDLNNTGKLVANFHPNKASVNPEELGSYLEGDILIPQKPITLRNGLNSRASRWPYGEVPFEIAGDFTSNELEVIALAMDEYHAKTCIRFIPRTSEADYISILNGKSGCWSTIGRLGGKQEINLQAPGCLAKLGTVIHELMHVLGFLHEQNRKERDSYVTIQLQNVQRNAAVNFQRMRDSVAFGVGYDYGSVMHYSPTAFSKNGQPTIVAKEARGRHVMGQRDGFSPLDIEKINRMYKCQTNRKSREPPIVLPERVISRSPFAPGFANNPFGSFIGNVFNGFNRFG